MKAREIKIPDFNESLAEFVDVHIGDGTLTPNLLRITGNKLYDYHYFLYLKQLVWDIFGIRASILYDKRSVNQKNNILLSITSKELSKFMHGLGIPYGDKIRNNCIIPEEILQDQKLAISCLRGLVDTDGSISRRDNYMCLSFDSHNPNLLKQVWTIGHNLGIFTHQLKDQIGTNSWKKIVRHFTVVGSSNLSNIIRFRERMDNNKRLYKYEVVKYFDKYKETKLPFKLGPWSSGYDDQKNLSRICLTCR